MDRSLALRVQGVPVKKWWAGQVAGLAEGQVTRSQMGRDLATAASLHLMKRLVSAKTPMAVRDKIALSIVPRSRFELKGKLPTPGDDDQMGELMGAYSLNQ